MLDPVSVPIFATAALPSATTYALFLAAAIALILTPGPDTLFVLSQGLQSREVGIKSAFGVTLGVLFHTGLAVVGIAALYRTVPGAESLVRLLGGVYLLYLGVSTLRNAGGGTSHASMGDGNGSSTAREKGAATAETTPTATAETTPTATAETTPTATAETTPTATAETTPTATAETTPVSGTSSIRQGFLVNALNPQVALFFLAFLPGFASGPATSIQMGLLGVTYAAITGIYLAGVAILTDSAARLVTAPRMGAWLDRVAGGVLLALGVWLAMG